MTDGFFTDKVNNRQIFHRQGKQERNSRSGLVCKEDRHHYNIHTCGWVTMSVDCTRGTVTRRSTEEEEEEMD